MAKRKRDSSALPATLLSSSSSSVVRKADGVAGGPSTPTAAKVEGKSKKAKGKQKATDDHHDVTVGEPAERERKAQVVYVLGHGSEDYKSTITSSKSLSHVQKKLRKKLHRLLDISHPSSIRLAYLRGGREVEIYDDYDFEAFKNRTLDASPSENPVVVKVYPSEVAVPPIAPLQSLPPAPTPRSAPGDGNQTPVGAPGAGKGITSSTASPGLPSETAKKEKGKKKEKEKQKKSGESQPPTPSAPPTTPAPARIATALASPIPSALKSAVAGTPGKAAKRVSLALPESTPSTSSSANTPPPATTPSTPLVGPTSDSHIADASSSPAASKRGRKNRRRSKAASDTPEASIISLEGDGKETKPISTPLQRSLSPAIAPASTPGSGSESEAERPAKRSRKRRSEAGAAEPASTPQAPKAITNDRIAALQKYKPAKSSPLRLAPMSSADQDHSTGPSNAVAGPSAALAPVTPTRPAAAVATATVPLTSGDLKRSLLISAPFNLYCRPAEPAASPAYSSSSIHSPGTEAKIRKRRRSESRKRRRSQQEGDSEAETPTVDHRQQDEEAGLEGGRMSPTPAVGAVEVVESPRSSSLDLVAAPPAPAAEGATPAESQPTGNRRRRKVKSTTPLPAMSQGHAETSTSSAVPAPTQVTQSTTPIATPRAVSSSTKTSSIMAAYRAKQGLSAPASPAADIAKDILAKLAARGDKGKETVRADNGQETQVAPPAKAQHVVAAGPQQPSGAATPTQSAIPRASEPQVAPEPTEPTVSVPIASSEPDAPEKRKPGRPRKSVLEAATVAPQDLPDAPEKRPKRHSRKSAMEEQTAPPISAATPEDHLASSGSDPTVQSALGADETAKTPTKTTTSAETSEHIETTPDMRIVPTVDEQPRRGRSRKSVIGAAPIAAETPQSPAPVDRVSSVQPEAADASQDGAKSTNTPSATALPGSPSVAHVLIPEVSSVTSTAAIEPEVESDTGAVSEPAAAVLTDSTGTSPQLPAEVNLQAAQTLEASSGPVNVPQPEVAQSAQDALAETPPIEQIMDEQAQTNSPVARPPIPPQSKWGVIRGRPSATACIICFDDGSHHIQAQCPVVKAGADALVPTLEARRAMPPSRDRSLSIEAIKNWLNRLETIAARVRGGEGNQRVGQPMIYEQVLPNGNGSHGAVRPGQQDAASSPTAAEVTLPSSVPSDALAEPSATTPQPTFTVLPQPTSVPAVTPIAPTSLPNGNLPLGIHLRALAKPRKNGSISGVSASSAIIETEPSDSESSDSENGENDSDESQGEGDSGSEDDDRPIIKRRRVQGADASDDEGTTSGTDSMSASDSDSNDGSDDSDTDSISTPPAGDPAELLQQIMSRPLSQRERRKARQSAASMLGGVAITPDASEAGDTVSESESEPEMEGKVFRAQGRRGSDSSIGDFVDLVDGDQVGGAGGETVESVVSEPEDEDEEPIIPSSLVEPPAFSAGETEPQLRSQNDESESAGDALPKNKSRSSRSFHDLEAEAGDSPDVDSFPGVVALDEARVEEDRPEMEAMEGVMQSTESREVVEGNGEAVATQPNGLARDLVQDLEETTPTGPRRRGRPPKVRPPSESAVDEPQASIQPSQQSDLPPSQPNDSSAPLSTELAAAPKRRGRPPKSKPDAAAPPTPASPLLADSLAASLETEAQTPRVTRTSQRLRSASREVQVPSPRVSTRAMSRGLTTSPLANVTRLPESPRVSMGGHDAVEAIPEETHAADGLQQDAQQRDVNGETEATPVAQRSGRMTRAASRELSALQLDLSDATVVDSQPWAKKRTGAETPSSQVDQLDSSQPITDVMPNGPNGNGEIIPASSQVSESTPRASRTARRSSLASTAPSETTQRARRSSRLSQTPSLPPSPVQAKSSSQPDPAIARKRPSESPLFMSQSQFPATQAYPAYPANILDSQIQTQNQTQESGSTRRSAGAKGSRASVRMTSPIQEEQEEQEEQEDGTGDDHTDAPTVNGHDRQETDGVPNGTEASESRFEGTHAHVAESRRTGESSDEDDDGDDDESTLPPTLSQRMLPVRPPPASQPSLSFPSLSGLDMSALRSGTAGKFSQNSSHSLRFSSSQPISSGLSTSTRGSRGGRAIKVISALSQGASAGADAASDTDDSRDSSSEEEEEDPRLRGRYAGGRPRRVKTNVQKGW